MAGVKKIKSQQAQSLGASNKLIMRPLSSRKSSQHPRYRNIFAFGLTINPDDRQIAFVETNTSSGIAGGRGEEGLPGRRGQIRRHRNKNKRFRNTRARGRAKKRRGEPPRRKEMREVIPSLFISITRANGYTRTLAGAAS
jgi:hypothetical protein